VPLENLLERGLFGAAEGREGGEFGADDGVCASFVSNGSNSWPHQLLWASHVRFFKKESFLPVPLGLCAAMSGCGSHKEEGGRTGAVKEGLLPRGCEAFAAWSRAALLHNECGGISSHWLEPPGDTAAAQHHVREAFRRSICPFLDLYDLQVMFAGLVLCHITIEDGTVEKGTVTSRYP
jgi:hypothetical protein